MNPVFDPDAQKSFWDHMFRGCVIRLVPAEEHSRRGDILRELEREVNTGAYSPRAIHGFLSTHKANGVPRFVPVFSFQDCATYFACVKAFDELLAQSAVADTFGGWSLGGKRRELEEDHAKEILKEDCTGEASIPVSAYNRLAWVKNWNTFWRLLAAKHEHAPAGSWFVMFDIANFYDSIDLPRLEREIRGKVPGNSLAIEVLFYFLSTWNKELNRYARATKGLPMDIVGDCSRVLANFYLTPFDRVMRDACQGRGAHYLRYADDMVLTCPKKDLCGELVFLAGKELHRIGLNINVAKVKYLDKEEFETWWGFSILNDLDVNGQLEGTLERLRTSWGEEGFGRKQTALKRAIAKLASDKQEASGRRWVYETAMGLEEFVLGLDERQMGNLLLISENPPEATTTLSRIILNSPYTQPKACLLRCLEKFRNAEDQEMRRLVESVIVQMTNLHDPVLDLATKTMPVLAVSGVEEGSIEYA